MGLFDSLGSAFAKLDPTSSKSAIRGALRSVDNAVGGAAGWANVTAVAGTALQAVPGVGQVAGGALLATSGGLKIAASQQAQAKFARQQSAAQVAEQRQFVASGTAAPYETAPPSKVPPVIILAAGALAVLLLTR